MRSMTVAAVAGLAIAAGLPGAVFADDVVATRQITGGRLSFVLRPNLSNATLSVTGPNDFHASSFSRSGEVAINLSRQGPLEDGTYRYQVTASSGETVTLRTPLDNGRDRPDAKRTIGVSVNGVFRVKGGEIIEPDTTKPQRKDQ